MKKSISLSIIREEHEKLRGTSNYDKYRMMSETKINGKWVFSGWAVPYEESAIIKQVKSNIYLMPDETTRYTVTENVKKLLNL